MINIEQVDIKLIKPYSNNNKLHDEKQVSLLAKQIKEHGFDVPIVVDKDYIIIKGHGRLLAATKLSMKKVPCIIRKDLNHSQIQAARIADNKLSESPWDTMNLANELGELRLAEYDVELTGFDNWDLQSMIEPPVNPEDNSEEKELTEKKLQVIILPKDEDEQQMIFLELRDRGFKVKV